MQQLLFQEKTTIPKALKDYLKFRIQNLPNLTNYPDPNLKKKHGRMGKRALKALAQELGLTEFNVNYNPSGIIDAGYVSLIGMLNKDIGIYISISSTKLFSHSNILYRNIRHIKDYIGGPNNFISEEELLNSYDIALNKIKNVMQKR